MPCKIFIGAYALVDATIQKQTVSVQCKNGHGYNTHAAFLSRCSRCNELVEITSKPISEPAHLYDLIGDAYDKFAVYGSDYGLHLTKTQFVITSDEVDDTMLLKAYIEEGWGVDELEPKNYEQYIYAFEAKFSKELAILREKANSVDVRFGVLVTWS